QRVPHSHGLCHPSVVPVPASAVRRVAWSRRAIGRARASGPERRAARNFALFALDRTVTSDPPKPGSFKKITSLANPLVKEIRALQQKKHRDGTGLFIAEGQKLVRDALDGGWRVEMLAYATSN